MRTQDVLPETAHPVVESIEAHRTPTEISRNFVAGASFGERESRQIVGHLSTKKEVGRLLKVIPEERKINTIRDIENWHNVGNNMKK